MGMSQERLGNALGLTFQQVQKYERGVNRVGAARLFDLSRILDVPISFFFGDMSEPATHTQEGAQLTRAAGDFVSHQNALDAEEMSTRRETQELVRAYLRINEPSVRKRVFDLIKSMGPTDA